MDNWDDLKFLVALSRVGTMTATAKLLGTNTATVSRRIDRLSEQLGVRAFVKTHDGWKPSEAVRDLIELAQSFDGELQSLLNSHIENAGTDAVSITIGTLPVVSSQVLFPGLKAHADLLENVQLSFSDRINREGLGDCDLVIHLGAPESGRVLTRKAGTLTFGTYRPNDSDNFSDWIGLPAEHDQNPLMQSCFDTFKCPPKARVENFAAIAALMNATGMAGPLPETMARDNPFLTRLDSEPWEGEFWLMYHETRRNDPGMRRVVDWVTKCFQDVNASSGAAAQASTSMNGSAESRTN